MGGLTHSEDWMVWKGGVQQEEGTEGEEGRSGIKERRRSGGQQELVYKMSKI